MKNSLHTLEALSDIGKDTGDSSRLVFPTDDRLGNPAHHIRHNRSEFGGDGVLQPAEGAACFGARCACLPQALAVDFAEGNAQLLGSRCLLFQCPAAVFEDWDQQGSVIGDGFHVEDLLGATDIGIVHRLFHGHQYIRPRQFLQRLGGQADLGRNVFHEVFELAAAGGDKIAQFVLHVLADVGEFLGGYPYGLHGKGVLLEFAAAHFCQPGHILKFFGLSG